MSSLIFFGVVSYWVKAHRDIRIILLAGFSNRFFVVRQFVTEVNVKIELRSND